MPQIPLVSISPPGDIQEGTHVTLTCISRSHLPVRIYSWYKTGSPTALQQWITYTIFGITSKDIGGYYCQTTSLCGHLISAPVNLQVLYGPRNTVVEIDPPGQIPEGSRVTLTCSTDASPPAHTYSWWYKGYTLLKTREKMLTFEKIHTEDSGEYLCRAVNRISQHDSPAVSVQVSYGPKNTVVELDPPGQITEGSRVTLTCNTDANPPAHTYSWYKTGRPAPLRNGKNLTFSKIRSDENGMYFCQAANGIGQQDSPAVSLQVLWATATLTCSSDANPPVENYTWFKVDESTPVGSGQQYSISNIRSEDAGQYYCEARNEYGAENASAVSIYIAEGQSPVLTAVVAVLLCGVVCLLCVILWVRKLKRPKPVEQDTSINLQSRGGGGDDDAQYSTIQPHCSRETTGGQEDDDQYSTIQPHCFRQTAGAQGDDVQYASVHFKKARAAQSSPNQPEGEPSSIYSSVQPRVDPSVVYSTVQPRVV
ncbi:hypothetical protein ACEWY4_017287 [Coilia grayii]|uniref:Ig-like domain-containing protein n=1 Tax=Coilia grayii TaxID=363190 RepID=A0ABD1JGE2_9TELE